MTDEIEQLKTALELTETHKKGAIRELEKVQQQLYDTQDRLKAAENVIAEKKHTEQLAGWAIDRALETLRVSATATISPFDVTAAAQTFCDWIKSSSAGEIK